MIDSLFDLLVCAECRTNFSKQENSYCCKNCCYSFPSDNSGIIYFSERGSGRVCNDFINQLQDKAAGYVQFLKLKVQRPSIDAYAAFQPFNESTRAIYPFIDLLKTQLKPGDWILDTWCRTGWTSNWLSSLFPEQNILSIWEGDRDILGYQGFNFWFDKLRRNNNQFILFCDLNEKIPIRDNSIKFINGLETLHRYKQSNVVHEFQRILTGDGILLHPHNHLSNAEPEPYFDRGERQLHGRVYDRYFATLLKDKDRQHFIMSEVELFNWDTAGPIQNNPDMTDYNALIGVLPTALAKTPIAPYNTPYQDISKLYALINPLLCVDFSKSKITIEGTHLNGAVDRILTRHPVYETRIRQLNGHLLKENELKFIYWAIRAKSLKEIESILNLSESELVLIAKNLEQNEIIQVHLLSENGAKMYYFQANQNYWPSAGLCTINTLWSDAESLYGIKPLLIIDNEEVSEITYEEAQSLIDAIQLKLAETGCISNDTVCIYGTLNFEAILLFWASTMVGIKVQILNTSLGKDIINKLIHQANPKLLFCSYDVADNVLHDSKVVFDSDLVQNATFKLFSEWIEEILEKERPSNVYVPESDDMAVMLYTSGSTGIPNAIELTHGQLFFSAKRIIDTFHWNSSDRYLATSDIDSMSGLRNTCLATLYAGCTIIIPEFDAQNKVFRILKSIKECEVNLLSTTPALLKQFVKLGTAIASDIQSVRTVICTAAILTEQLANRFYELFGIKILNYYGLTETAGICLANLPDSPIDMLGALGIPVEGIVQLVDEDDNIVQGNSEGEIRVYGNNVIKHYGFETTGGFKFKNGWLYTGDMAICDNDGYFHFKDRKRNILKNINGETIYLTEVKAIMAQCPLIEDIYLATFLHNDIELLAAICTTNNLDYEEELIAAVKKLLSDQIDKSNHPDIIKIVKEIPYNNRGKVDIDTFKKIIE